MIFHRGSRYICVAVLRRPSATSIRYASLLLRVISPPKSKHTQLRSMRDYHLDNCLNVAARRGSGKDYEWAGSGIQYLWMPYSRPVSFDLTSLHVGCCVLR